MPAHKCISVVIRIITSRIIVKRLARALSRSHGSVGSNGHPPNNELPNLDDAF